MKDAHIRDSKSVLDAVNSSPDGLSSKEVIARQERFGKNLLSESNENPLWREMLREITEPMILLLLGIGVLYSLWGKMEDALTIFAVITTLVFVEVYNESRARKTIAALNKLSEPTALVRREGKDVEVKVEDIVPGDILILGAGRRIPTDACLLTSYGLSIEESALTGESAPREKSTAPVGEEAELAERTNMVFAGTVVIRGRGTAVVTAIGMSTELGRIAGLARKERPPKTVLQKTMKELTKWMVVLAVTFSTLVPFLGWLINGQDPQQMLLTGLSLAFATIPEELPIIITMVLAIGGFRLSRQNAIVKKLQAVETLGAVTVICTDKTGTLTTNHMVVQEIWPGDRRKQILHLASLANDVSPAQDGLKGDPLDVAVVEAAKAGGLDVEDLRRTHPVVTEHTFDNIRRRMSVVYEYQGERMVAAKGSPEAMLPRCDWILRNSTVEPLDSAEKEEVLRLAEEMAAKGLRVVAVAGKKASEKFDLESVESGLILEGLIGLADPPRSEAKDAIAACTAAGIKVVMLTGDHPQTAKSIADKVGLHYDRILTGAEIDRMDEGQLRKVVEEDPIYARVTPEHKLLIVKALQANGERVAVTGDGINDSPALSAADIGVAMGEGGTDVARESADMVLADNNFATITNAVKEGRVLFNNLTNGVRYYLACKVALITISLIGVLSSLPIPFTPVQIILMELFMDLGASAAFVAEKSEQGLMTQPPRDPRVRFMDRPMVTSIFVSSIGLIAAVSAAYLLSWNSYHNVTMAQTTALVTWLFGHALLAFNMRSQRRSLFNIGPLSNHIMVIWAVAAGLFAIAVTTIPLLFDAVKTTALGAGDWAMVLILAIAGTFWLELLKMFRNRRNK